MGAFTLSVESPAGSQTWVGRRWRCCIRPSRSDGNAYYMPAAIIKPSLSAWPADLCRPVEVGGRHANAVDDRTIAGPGRTGGGANGRSALRHGLWPQLSKRSVALVPGSQCRQADRTVRYVRADQAPRAMAAVGHRLS